MEFILSILKIVISVTLIFVWVVRYDNIVKEFSEYSLPNWFRDLMGVTKLSAAAMLLYGTDELTLLAASILLVLMLCAFAMHIKHKHHLIQMIPSFSLTVANLFLISQTYYYVL